MTSMSCPFCSVFLCQSAEKPLIDTEEIAVLIDAEPFTPGHFLVVPKTHVTELCFCDETLLNLVMHWTKKIAIELQSMDEVKGVSIFQNNGQVSGNHVAHLHWHVIARFSRDEMAIKWSIPETENDKQLWVQRHNQATTAVINMQKTFEIRKPLSISEYRQWIELVNKSLNEKGCEFMGRNLPVSLSLASEWARQVEQESQIALVAISNSVVVGGCHLAKGFDRKSHCGTLSILVDHDYRSYGVGSKLIRKMIDFSYPVGIRRIFAEPIVNNYAAINLLLKCGFVIEGIQRGKILMENGDSFDCYSMAYLF